MQYRDDLHELIEPAVEAAGYELYGVQFISQGKYSTLRVFIEHDNGITVDDCAEASHQVSAVLDVEDPISGEYNLEVSSSGVDRALLFPEHFQSAAGETAEVTLRFAIEKRKKFKGIIDSVDDTELKLQCGDDLIALPLDDIAKAHLVVNF